MNALELNHPSSCVGDDVTKWDICEGTQHAADGTLYVGEFRMGKKNGRGMAFFADGSKYMGFYSEDKMEGLGVLIFVGGDSYVGEFHGNEMTGKGMLYQSDNQVIIGEFYQGVLTREAILKDNAVASTNVLDLRESKNNVDEQEKIKVLLPESISILITIGFIIFCLVVFLYPPFNSDVADRIKSNYRGDWRAMILVLIIGSAVFLPKFQDIYPSIRDALIYISSDKKDAVVNQLSDGPNTHR